MVSVCGMRLFFVFYHSVDHWSDRSALAGADGGGIDGTAGTCRPVGNHGSERIAGFFSGTGIHFCLCVYHGWLYDGTVPRNSGSAFYEKTEKRLAGRGGMSCVQYGDLSGISALCHSAVRICDPALFYGREGLEDESVLCTSLPGHGSCRSRIVLRNPADSVEITGKGAGYLSGDQFHGAGRFRSGAVCNDPGNVC